MSERYSPKKLLRERAKAAAIAEAPKITIPTVLEPTQDPLLGTCRLHGQPWRSCTLCSTPRKKGT